MTKVLVIDDDNTILSMVASILEQAGYMPVTAVGGEAGLEMAKKELPAAILLDRQMPNMDGNQVLMQLKDGANTRDVPVIMLTTDNKVSDVSTCLEIGAVDYIVKPFNKDNFLIRLDRALKNTK